jgi:hypothetical protein
MKLVVLNEIKLYGNIMYNIFKLKKRNLLAIEFKDYLIIIKIIKDNTLINIG